MNGSLAYLPLADAAADTDLIRAISRKDERALASIYDRYAPLCYNIAFRIANDRSAAQGILQDAFWKIWAKAAHYDGRGTVAGWIVRITRNQALDWLRHERVYAKRIAYSWDESDENVERDNAGVDENADPERRMLVLESRRLIRDALRRLPAEQRSAVELAFLEGMTHQAISETTGVPLGTVKTRVRLGLQKLRTLLIHADAPN